MNLNNLRLALATAGIVAAVGAISVAAAAKPASNNGKTQSPGGYGNSQCSDGKWQALGFKNHGQCVSFFVHQVNGGGH